MRSRRRLSVLAALLSITVPAAVGAQQPNPPVVAIDPVLTGGGTRLTITLTNSTASAVTAWGITLSFTMSDGQVRVEGRTADGYLGAEGIEMTRAARQRVVRAHGRSEPTFLYPPGYWPSPVVDVGVKLDFAIFENGTAAGSESGIAEVFEQRAADARVLRRMRDALGQVGDTVSGRPALERASSLLEFPDAGTAADTYARVARRNVAMMLERVRSGRMTASEADSFRRNLLNDTAARAEAAVKHAVRR